MPAARNALAHAGPVQDPLTSIIPDPFTAPRSKVIVRSHPAAVAERSIRQSAKSAWAF